MPISYIPDREIDLNDENDLLGTISHVETLSEIIDKCDTPFTIGLLGGWGAGKSSIIKTLQKNFNENESKGVKVFVYDAWKYSRDSFRRTFILELKKFFNIDTTKEFDSFYKDTHEEILGKVGIVKGWWLYAILFLIPIVFINFVPFFLEKKFEYTTFIISLIVSGLTAFVANTFVQYKISVTKPKMFAPEQFEEIFKEIIQEVTSAPKNPVKWIISKLTKRSLKKVVIVLDNIDRCHHEVAIELLLSVKNFLEINNVIFLIPIDETGVKGYLKISNQDANEFLRKLFSTTLRLKNFSDNELYDFSFKLVKKTGIEIPGEVLAIVCQEFSTNPRRIIQFLNILQTEILLAEKQEKKHLVPDRAITGNLAVLAKLMIIRDEWPDLWRKLSDAPSLLQKINRGFRDKQYQFNAKQGKWVFSNDDIDLDFNEECYRFLMRTHQFEVDNLEAFFLNRDVHIGIPDELKRLVESQDWDRIKELIQENEISVEKLLDFISDKIDRDVVKHRLFSTSGFNILSLIFKLASDDEYKDKLDNIFSPKALGKIKSLIRMGEINDMILNFNPDDLCNFAKWLDENGTNDLANRIAIVISSTDFTNERFQGDESLIAKIREKVRGTAVSYIKAFSHKPEYLKRIKDMFSAILIEDIGNKDLLDVFQTQVVSDNILDEEIIEKLVASLNPDFNVAKVQEIVVFLHNLRIRKGLTETMKLKYLNQVIQFINTTDFKLLDYWFTAISGFIEVAEKKADIIKLIYKSLSRNFNHLYGFYNSDQQQTNLMISTYKRFLECAKELFFVTESNYENDENILNWIGQFFQSNKSSDVYLSANRIYQDIIKKFPGYGYPFSTLVIDRFKNMGNWEHKVEIGNTVTQMLNSTDTEAGLEDDQVKEILDQYIDLYISDSEEHVDTAKNWLHEIIKNEYIANIMFNYFAGIKDITRQRKVLDIVKELGDLDYLDTMIGSIISQTSDERLISVIEDIESKYGITENNVAKLIDDKLKSLLGSPELQKQLIAVNIINKLKNIPEDDIGLLITLLNDVDEEKYNDDEKVLLNNVKSRFQ